MFAQYNINFNIFKDQLNQSLLILFSSKEIKYRAKFEEIKKFVDSSVSCHQFTRIDCHHMVLFDKISQYGALVDRNNKTMLYFGGGPQYGKGKYIN